jgi:TrmH family RNA methyltransferase
MPSEIITSRDNPQVKRAVRLRESARERRARGLFFVEGFRLCSDALASGYAPEVLFVTEEARRKYPPPPAPCPLLTISEAVAQKLADTQSPQGLFGIWRQADESGKSELQPQPGASYIALEAVQDPANLGAVARTAEALGLAGLVVSGGCDIWHPKALRASMGALLRLPVAQTEDLPAFLRGAGLPCYAAVPGPGAVPLPACDFSGGAVVAIGNEGGGLSDEAIAACGRKLTIPMRGRAESLNAAAAAAIIMWEMRKDAE